MNYSQQTMHWVWLSLIEGMTPKRFYQLLAKYEEPEAVFELAGADGMRFLGENVCAAMRLAKDKSRLNEVAMRMDALGGRIITRLDDDYPQLLREIYDPPTTLYVLGEMPWLDRECVGIVGTRRPTPYGVRAAYDISKGLAGAGLCVVSGLARGVDAEAHKGCVEGGGATVAVQGCGLDIIYPHENSRLRTAILAGGGAVIAEYPPGVGPRREHFPARNRIVSGMSRGVLVVEAGMRSGAMITARLAEEQNRDIFAVPGSPYAAQSEGPLELCKNGAVLTRNAEDILREYGLVIAEKRAEAVDAQLEPYEIAVLNHLRERIMTFDEIIESTKFTPAKCNSLLTSMELRGIIRRTPDRQYMAMK